MPRQRLYSTMTADEAAYLVPDGSTVAFSGFSPAGTAKVVPRILAERARRPRI
jgi:acetyl-CoA hydrolase